MDIYERDLKVKLAKYDSSEHRQIFLAGVAWQLNQGSLLLKRMNKKK